MNSETEMQDKQYAKGPASQGGPLGGRYYFLEMKLSCQQFFCYACGGTEMIQISEAADESFHSLTPVAQIEHTHACDAFRSDPYRSSFQLGGSRVARAQRIALCCTPVCTADQVRLSRPNGQSMGRLLTQGCCSMACNITDASRKPQFRVETRFCHNGYWYILYKIYDAMGNEVGQMTLDECHCCHYRMKITMPQAASFDQRLMIFFAAEHFISIVLERQQNNNN